MKRFFGVLTVAFAMVASANLAADCYGCNKCEEGTRDACGSCKRCCKPKMDCCCDPETGKMVKKERRCGHGNLELLYMRACRGLHFATTGAAGATTELAHRYSEDDWELGFRVGRTFPMPCRAWDLRLEYMQLSADGDGSYTDPDAGATAVGVLSGLGSLDRLAFTSEVDHRVLDLVVQMSCCACAPLELIPYGGFRAMWMDQEFVETIIDPNPTNGDGANYTSDYTGYGLTTGLGWVFHSNCPVDLFGKFGGSVVCGENKTTKQVKNANAIVHTIQNNKPHRASFGFEASIGVSKEACYCGCPWVLSLSWEVAHWTNIDNPMTYHTANAGEHGSSTSTDISFHGLAVRAQTTF